MIDYNLISTIGNVDADVEKQLSEAFGNAEQDNVMDTVLGGEVSNTAAPGELVSGTVVGKAGDDVIIELGLKSEGRVHRSEFENWDEIAAGDEIEVLFEGVDDLSGEVHVSKRKADRIRGWETILQDHNEGDEIEVRRPGDHGDARTYWFQGRVVSVDKNQIYVRMQVLDPSVQQLEPWPVERDSERIAAKHEHIKREVWLTLN